MAKGKLSDLHRATIDAYFLNAFNQERAMLTAGYAKSTARHYPKTVFDRPDVKAEIARRQARTAKKHNLSEDWVIERLMKLAMSGDILAPYKHVQEDGTITWDFTDAPEEDLALVRELKTEVYQEGRGKDAVNVKKFQVKEPDIHGALIALARHLGLFNDKLEITGSLAERLQAGKKQAYAKAELDREQQNTIH